MKLKIFILFFCFSVLFFSCKKDNNAQNNNNNNNNNTQVNPPRLLDIKNSSTLFIAQSSSFKTDGSDPENRLFKVTADGLVVEVTVKDEMGSDITRTVQPKNICNLNDDFFTATYQFNGNGNTQTYLVRKSDGAVFSGEKIFSRYFSSSDRSDLIVQEDGAGNIYYNYQTSGGGNSIVELIKLNVSNPQSLTTERYSASGDDISLFVVDKNANILYAGKDANQKAITRYRNNSSGFTNLNASSSMFFTDATKENMYTIRTSFSGVEKNTIYKLNTQTSAFELSPDTSGILHIKKSCTVKGQNKVLLYGVDWNFNNDYIFEFTGSNPIATAKIPTSSLGLLGYPSGNILPVESIIASYMNYYILGNDNSFNKVLIKVDGATHSYTKLVLSSDYDIQQLVIGKNDELMFYGIRMSDGNKVLARINISGNIEVLTVFDNTTVNSLERIN